MGDRAVYCARLESVCAERHPGFESLPIRHFRFLRHTPRLGFLCGLFLALSPCLAATVAPVSTVVDHARNLLHAGQPEESAALLQSTGQESAEALDLRGAIFLEQGRLEEARTAFAAAHKANPALFLPRLHLADAHFRARRYPEARAAYEEVLRETNILISNERLRFAVLMTFLAEKNEEKAQAAFAAIKFPTESPSYYYAQAAWAFAHGEKRAARRWRKTAGQIFEERTTRWFERMLFDLGWLDDQPAPTAE